MTLQLHTPADVDARAFVYPMAALSQKLGWELDAKTAELARAREQVFAAQQQVETLQSELSASSRHAAELLRQGPNPLSHQKYLQYLVHCRAQLQAAQVELDGAKHLHAQLHDQCVALHAKCEGLARHRDEVHGAFIQELRHQQAGERDRDWLARRFLAAQRTSDRGASS